MEKDMESDFLLTIDDSVNRYVAFVKYQFTLISCHLTETTLTIPAKRKEVRRVGNIVETRKIERRLIREKRIERW